MGHLKSLLILGFSILAIGLSFGYGILKHSDVLAQPLHSQKIHAAQTSNTDRQVAVLVNSNIITNSATLWITEPGEVSSSAYEYDYLYRASILSAGGMAWGPDGYLYVADGDHITRMSPDGSHIEEWGVWNITDSTTPVDIVFDAGGTAYVSGPGDIYRVNPDKSLTRLPGIQGGMVTMAFSPSNELYYTDGVNGNIWKVVSGGVQKVASGIYDTEFPSFGPDGHLYADVYGQDKVVKINVNTGAVSDFFLGNISLGADPAYVATDSDGDIWIRGLAGLYQVGINGTVKPYTIDGMTYSGSNNGFIFGTVGGITFDDQGRLWIGSFDSKIARLDPTGTPDVFSLNLVHSGFYSIDLDVGPDDYIYTENWNTKELWKISPGGTIEVLADTSWTQIRSVAVNIHGDLYVSDFGGDIYRVNDDGSFTLYADLSVTRMAFGVDGYLYACNGESGQQKSILRFTGPGNYVTFLTEINGESFGTMDINIAAGPTGGLYLLDEINRKVYFTDFDGNGRTLADFSDDPGPDDPAVMTVSPYGDLFFWANSFAGSNWRFGAHGFWHLAPTGQLEFIEYDEILAGDPLGMGVSRDGRYLYETGSGVIVRYTIPGTFPTEFSISGTVRHANGKGFSGAIVSTNGSSDSTSGADGTYQFDSLPLDVYTITPTLTSHVFYPPTRTLKLPPDATRQDFIILTQPVSTTLTPSVSQTFTYTDTQGLVTQFYIPANAVSEPLILTIVPHTGSSDVGSGLSFAGHAFDVVVERGTEQLDGFEFSTPVSLTLYYSDDDIDGVKEEVELALMQLSGGDWQDATETCTSPSGYIRDLDQNQLTLSICQAGQFALFGPPRTVYLPIISHN